MSFSVKTLSRDIVTPVTIMTFVVSTVTGIMLLVHWKAGLVRFSHEWLSLVFSAAGIWHFAKNWKAFTLYLKRNAAVATLAISLIVSAIVTGMTGTVSNISPGAVFRTLSNATLDIAAPAFGMAPNDAIALLKAANIEAAGGETLGEIGKRAGIGAAAITSMLATKGAPR